MYLYVIVFYFTTIVLVIAKSILKNVMFTWKCAVDEMYVTSLPVNYPLKNTSITPALYTFGESASVTQFVYHMWHTVSHQLRKMRKNDKYRTFPYISFIYLLQKYKYEIK